MDRRRFVAAMGSALAAPAAWAQHKLARIGVMEFGSPPDSSFVRAYLTALAQLGYTDPANLRVERRYAQGSPDRFYELARDLVAHRVHLVFTVGNDIAQAAKKAAPGLVIITAGSEDPVLSGLIADYRRPGGNVTGVTYLSPQLADKRLELLKEAVPGLVQVAVLWDPAHFDTYYNDMQPAARALGVKLQLFEVRRAEEFEPAFAAARKSKAGALFVIPSRLFNLNSKRIGELALAARLPMMAAYANFTDAGGLISYGAVAADMLQRAAAQT